MLQTINLLKIKKTVKTYNDKYKKFISMILLVCFFYSIFFYLNQPYIKETLTSNNLYKQNNTKQNNFTYNVFLNNDYQINYKYHFYIDLMPQNIIERLIYIHLNSTCPVDINLQYNVPSLNITTSTEWNDTVNLNKEIFVEKNATDAVLYVTLPNITYCQFELNLREICVINEINYTSVFFYAKLSGLFILLFLIYIKYNHLTPDILLFKLKLYALPYNLRDYRKEYIKQEDKLPHIIYYFTLLITLLIMSFISLIYIRTIQPNYHIFPLQVNFVLLSAISISYVMFFISIILYYLMVLFVNVSSNYLHVILNSKLFQDYKEYNKLIELEGNLFNKYLRSNNTKLFFILYSIFLMSIIFLFGNYFFEENNLLQFFIIMLMPIFIYFSFSITQIILELSKIINFDIVVSQYKGVINSYFFVGIIMYMTFDITQILVLKKLYVLFLSKILVKNNPFSFDIINIFMSLMNYIIKPMIILLPTLILLLYWIVSFSLILKTPQELKKKYKNKFIHTLALSLLTLLFSIILSQVFTPLTIKDLVFLIQVAFTTGMCDDYLEIILGE